MSYTVKEIFYTLQGEGGNAGRAAVFCRFAGCNLWSGREVDRSSAQCRFCDTDFVGADGSGGGKFASAEALADQVAAHWPLAGTARRLVVLTGGEPLLQVDDGLVHALHERGFEIAVETNGTVGAPQGLDWICVSPKAHTGLKLRQGQELKVVVPQPDLDLDQLIDLPFDKHLLQPMDGPRVIENTRWAVEYCLRDPRWQLSVQTHKMLGIR
ncbi:7-carboxy-7-deazaguanine synthase [Hydrogenophaga laconesensis]|uniref:7-carboxy-7-deazaguanine synthase n=1 Tax=Hydrogenophaga laconesensis TaxID=1805971 RepID=A0ABU1VFV4_9BURK|nr:7-carboxy-7-deazaguanine synthase [Hydrogenophaga laconesensis]MDR7096359.1 7-carboxy-7-deazaguanine synthase (Cx14CxxC type) [Hydrogenophaga laconesensis]